MPVKKAAPIETSRVGLVASTGGLAAVKQLFLAMPADSGMAFVLIAVRAPGPRQIGHGSNQQAQQADEQLVHQLEYELKTSRKELQSTIDPMERSNELKASNVEVIR